MKQYFAPFLLLVFTLSGCTGSASKKVADGVPAKSGSTMGNSQKKIDNIGPGSSTVYFKGVGTEPFWGVEISGEKIKFTSLSEGLETFSTPAVEPVRAADADVKRYRAHTEGGELSVQITQGDCSDGMSDKNYGYKVTVQIKRGIDTDFRNFEGCGDYIADYRLHDIWVLEKLNGEMVTTSDFPREFPSLEINAKDNTFFGFSGCNQISGTIFAERELLRFSAATTLMACQDTREVQFMTALNAVTHYSIENNRLTLSNPNGVLLVFKKVD
ncbi:META domain-containing protein [Flavobacteriaceae bacterium F89]|uniref:META domain-containing protein n=1 Tax=Cerina litoralis TaxID=2874477 RepID=A0AAE3EY45_9FLAO|nr:META domain-containing protein [Cerina litoralis]MCG2461857.1 META domain-containing protein [Cerina litoralis]